MPSAHDKSVNCQRFTEALPPKPAFNMNDFTDQTGRIAIVTGSNTGMGKATCSVLLRKGAKVYMACRSEEKAKLAIEDLIRETGSKDIYFLKLDLANLASIKGTVAEFLRKESQLHLLFNNAGVMQPPVGSKTPQGHELQLGTNLLGPVLFTKLLLPTMLVTAQREYPLSSKDGKQVSTVRILHTSSIGHSGAPVGGIKFEDPNSVTGMPLYAQSKWGNIVFSNQLAERYGSQGLISHSLSPGLVTTDLQRHMPAVARKIMHTVFKDADEGCLTQIAGGLLPQYGDLEKNGLYLIPFGRVGIAREDTNDHELGKKTWDWLEKMVAPYA